MDELESVNQRIEQLKSELSQLEKRRNELLSSTVNPVQTLLTPGQKIELFQSYFRGNHHCYAALLRNSMELNQEPTI
ncbi:hypothetical protein BCT90_18360 [Vibrio lentus]|uniref:Uncharacterized protein n=3 Tax=Vibrio TaxID=662 RepID=A0A2N7BIR7_9VIBR|nr:hypothetical protein BCV34_22850 [Vibrio lentus]PME56148.1 hypothetical protein BCV30_19315 [Vibrio lentus]PME94808.1 hypothetical protein BCV27_19905 [Vibrio lentus]PMH91914.1 hypothetical protein BCU56_10845 [Vibrio lentus]PMI09654.1 hypothetical protein BCU53_22995 [Vibrio lentus]